MRTTLWANGHVHMAANGHARNLERLAAARLAEDPAVAQVIRMRRVDLAVGLPDDPPLVEAHDLLGDGTANSMPRPPTSGIHLAIASCVQRSDLQDRPPDPTELSMVHVQVFL